MVSGSATMQSTGHTVVHQLQSLHRFVSIQNDGPALGCGGWIASVGQP